MEPETVGPKSEIDRIWFEPLFVTMAITQRVRTLI